MPTALMYSEQYSAALSGSGPRARGRASMIVSVMSGKKWSISVAHSTPMKPAPTMSTEALRWFRSCSLWYSSKTWRRRPSRKRSSRCAQEPSGRASSWIVGNHSDSPHLWKTPKLQPAAMMQKSKSMVCRFSLNMGLIVAMRSSPSKCLTSPQMNLHPMRPSITGQSVNVNASKCFGFTYARNTPGVYSKNSFASTIVTR
mmetsp:Transcript_14585/g.33383  ORF Transcript_14585/g.33383 Transcript_14585/m.33383 type:complete len:200 (+) Transcript_14585:924-1523(+)